MANQKVFFLNRHRVIIFLILLVIPVLGFWHVSLFQFTMKWDMMDQIYPWRYYISECLQHGYLPSWNPFENMGYPIHADPQSGSWYPIVWIISLLSGYSICAMHVEFVLHIFLAGIGMYLLSRVFGLEVIPSLIVAICYQGSGFMVGNAQHFAWIVAAAWVPFVFYFYYKAYKNNSLNTILAGSLSMFMLLTGGYPAFSIITHYTLLLVFVFLTGRLLINQKPVGRFLLTNLLMYGTFCLLSAAYLYGFAQILPYITREQIELHQAMHGSFTIPSLISLVFPFGISGADAIFNTDVSLRNIYFGLLPIIMIIPAIFLRKDPRFILSGIFGLLCLLVSFGDLLPLREWLFRFVPLMDSFRFPAIFRLFSVIGFLLPAGYGIGLIINGNAFVRKWWQMSVWGMGLFLLLVLIISITNINSLVLPNVFSPSAFDTYLAATSPFDRLMLQAIVQLVIAGGLLLVLILIKNKSIATRLLIGFVLIDISGSVWLNQPMTVTTYGKPARFQAQLNALPDGFPIPDKEPMIGKTDYGRYIYPMWYNMGIMHKITAVDGYNPIWIKTYDRFIESAWRDTVLQNPLLWFSNDIHPHPVDMPHTSGYTHHTVMASIEEPLNDSAKYYSIPGIKSFGASHLETEISVPVAGILVFLQNQMPGWGVTVNGKKADLLFVNFGFNGVYLDKGTHHVRFEYQPKGYRFGIWFTWLLFSCLLAFLFIRAFITRKQAPAPEYPLT